MQYIMNIFTIHPTIGLEQQHNHNTIKLEVSLDLFLHNAIIQYVMVMDVFNTFTIKFELSLDNIITQYIMMVNNVQYQSSLKLLPSTITCRKCILYVYTI